MTSLRREEYTQVFNQNEKGRDFVTGDIHGNKKAFIKALDLVCFDKSKDRLFCTGDLIDGGADSLFIVNQLKEDWFFAIRGNHEQFLIYAMKITDGFKRAKAIGDHKSNGGKWFHKLSSKDSKMQIANELDNLPYAITLKTSRGEVGLVHGEVPKRCESWSVLIERLQGIGDSAYALAEIEDARENAIWGRTAITDGYDYFRGKFIHKDYQIKRSISGIDVTVHGHTGVYEPVVWGNQVWIDTCGKTGALTILQTEALFELVANAKREKLDD